MSRRAVRAAALALATGVAAATFAWTGTAAAHSSLISTSPKQDGKVREPVDHVELRFSDEIQQRFATIAVTDPDGNRVSAGKPTVDGGVVEQPVKPFRATGRYLVGWRVVSADGHPVSGKFAFTVTKGAVAKPSSSPPSASPSPTPSGTPARRVAQQAVDDRSFIERHAAHLLIGAVVVLAGVAIIIWERRRRSQGS